MDEPLIKQVKFTQAITPTNGAAGTTDINGAALDMQGFGAVLMVVTFGAITTNAVTSIKAQQGLVSNLSDAADLVGTAQTVADDDDEKTFYIDLIRPQERYVRLLVDRGTQNAVVASAYYIQYNPDNKPTVQPTGVAGEIHLDKIEGTA